MNFAAMRYRAAELANRPGVQDQYPQADWADHVNDAIGTFSWAVECNLNTITVQLIQNQPEYLLPLPYWKYFTDVLLGPADGSLLYALHETTEGEVRRNYPGWLLEPQATPTLYWMSDPTTLRVYPTPPDGSNIVTLRGVQEIAPLVLDSDVPAIPSTYHENLCQYAALQHLKTFLAGDDPYLVSLKNDYAKGVADCKDWFGDVNAEFQRTVTPRSLGRVPLGAYSVQRGAR